MSIINVNNMSTMSKMWTISTNANNANNANNINNANNVNNVNKCKQMPTISIMLKLQKCQEWNASASFKTNFWTCVLKLLKARRKVMTFEKAFLLKEWGLNHHQVLWDAQKVCQYIRNIYVYEIYMYTQYVCTLLSHKPWVNFII